MKINKLQIIFFTLLLLLIPFFTGNVVFAKDKSQMKQVGFSVYPNYNDAQNKTSSFFDLLVNPKSKQTIGVTVTNTSQEASNYIIEIKQASTNKNGLIDYTVSKASKLGKAPFRLSKHSSYEKKLQLEAGESKQVPIILDVPDKAFKGEVLGGVNVTKTVPQTEQKPQLVNQYSYVIGLRIREGPKNPERSLSAGDAKPIVSFGKTGVTVPIINAQASAMGHLKVDSLLRRDGKKIKTATYKDREIAPNSVYPYSLSWDEKDYLPGEYQLAIAITDKQKNKWIFNKKFYINAEEVNKIKNSAIHPQKENHTWIWILICLLIVIIMALFWYILSNRKRGEKKDDQKTHLS